jgi:DNA-binding beta-propeller fold protein YncE
VPPASALALALSLAVLLPLSFTGVLAIGTDQEPAGTASVTLGALSATPAAPSVGEAACTPTADTQTNVPLSWTDSQSATLSASGAALVSGYRVGRATTSAGPFATADTVSISPPAVQPATATDVNPSGAPTPTALVIRSAAIGIPFLESAPTTAGANIALNSGVVVSPNNAQATPTGTTVVVAGRTKHVQVLQKVAGLWTDVKDFTTVTGAEGVAVDPVPVGGHYVAYVVEKRAGANDAYVWPFTLDGAASTKGTEVTVGRVGIPVAITVLPNGSAVYVADFVTRELSYFPTATPPATASTVTLPGSTPEPEALAATPTSAHVYVLDKRNSEIDDISVSSHAVTKTIVLAAGALTDANNAQGAPNLVAVLPTATEMYVDEYGANAVVEVNTALAVTNPDTVAATVPLATGGPVALAVSPNGCLVYAATDTTRLDVIDTWDNAESKAATLLDVTDPQSMAMTPDDRYLYVPEVTANVVEVVATGGTATAVATAAKPTTVVVTPSPYWYEVTATHALWSSDTSAPVFYAEGFNPGGWQ